MSCCSRVREAHSLPQNYVPCLSVPMGFGPNGLPLGLSITGNLFGENTILQIGMTYQRETNWHRRRPPA